MAYIDLDEINRLHPKLTAKYPLSFANGISVAISEINRLPNADVVPKSEVEKLRAKLAVQSFQDAATIDGLRFELKVSQGLMEKGLYSSLLKITIAAEIFAEIEDVLNHFGYFDEIDFNALKKKYTEGDG
jgi:hypothetical protein